LHVFAHALISKVSTLFSWQFWRRLCKIDRRALAIALVAMSIVALVIPLCATHAKDLGQFVAEALGSVLLWIASLLAKVLGQLVILLINIVGFNNFVDSEAVTKAWVVIRDIFNMLITLAVLYTAIVTVLDIPGNYQWTSALPKILISAVLVNFSKTISGFIIDAGQVLTLTFVNAFKETAPGNLLNALGLDVMLKLRPELVGNKDAMGTLGTMFDMLGVFLVAVIVLLAAIAVMLSLILFFIKRIVYLWFLVATSPVGYLDFLPSQLGMLSKLSSQWWSTFTEYVFQGVGVAFTLWLAFTIMSVAPGQTPVFNKSSDSSALNSQNNNAIVGDTEVTVGEFSKPERYLAYLMSLVLMWQALQMAQGFGGAAGNVAKFAIEKGTNAAKWAGDKSKALARTGASAAGVAALGGLAALGKGASELGKKVTTSDKYLAAKDLAANKLRSGMEKLGVTKATSAVASGLSKIGLKAASKSVSQMGMSMSTLGKTSSELINEKEAAKVMATQELIDKKNDNQNKLEQVEEELASATGDRKDELEAIKRTLELNLGHLNSQIEKQNERIEKEYSPSIQKAESIEKEKNELNKIKQEKEALEKNKGNLEKEVYEAEKRKLDEKEYDTRMAIQAQSGNNAVDYLLSKTGLIDTKLRDKTLLEKREQERKINDLYQKQEQAKKDAYESLTQGKDNLTDNEKASLLKQAEEMAKAQFMDDIGKEEVKMKKINEKIANQRYGGVLGRTMQKVEMFTSQSYADFRGDKSYEEDYSRKSDEEKALEADRLQEKVLNNKSLSRADMIIAAQLEKEGKLSSKVLKSIMEKEGDSLTSYFTRSQPQAFKELYKAAAEKLPSAISSSDSELVARLDAADVAKLDVASISSKELELVGKYLSPKKQMEIAEKVGKDPRASNEAKKAAEKLETSLLEKIKDQKDEFIQLSSELERLVPQINNLKDELRAAINRRNQLEKEDAPQANKDAANADIQRIELLLDNRENEKARLDGKITELVTQNRQNMMYLRALRPEAQDFVSSNKDADGNYKPLDSYELSMVFGTDGLVKINDVVAANKSVAEALKGTQQDIKQLVKSVAGTLDDAGKIAGKIRSIEEYIQKENPSAEVSKTLSALLEQLRIQKSIASRKTRF